MLKKRISDSKKLGQLKSDSARLLYTWLLCHLDVEGRYSADPDLIKGHVFPKIKSMTCPKIKRFLTELARVKLIILYDYDNERYLEFKKFHKEQILRRDREAVSKIPPPSKGTVVSLGVLQESSGVNQENSRTSKDKISKDKISKVNTIAPNDKENRSEQKKINYNFDSRKWENITEEDVKLWKETYPACDAKEELLRMGDWLISNPTKRKSNYRKFISNWLSRSQDKGGTMSKRKKTALMGPTKW